MANPIVRVKQGQLKGIEATNDSGRKYFTFKGIPYAEPPVNDLRFKDPIPIKPWTGVRDATKEGNCCIQSFMLKSGDVKGAEDCLFLNVYTPCLPTTDTKKLNPVIVYIHGGGFKAGTGNQDDFGPDFFMDTDTVFVSINYRVGVLGFLCLDTPDVPGNAGLKDQSLALRWIKENITSFGGDSNNITIQGISAGSASVEYHIISPMSSGLFHKAILQSGSTLNPWAFNHKPNEFLNKLKLALGIKTDDSDELLKQLQEIDATSLIKLDFIDEETLKSCSLFGFVPVVEKRFEHVDGFLNSTPLQILKSGVYFDGPTITGFCRDEGSLFKMFFGDHVSQMVNEEYADYMSWYNVKDSAKINNELSDVYKMENLTGLKRVDEFLSDLAFVSGIYASLKYRTKSNNKNQYLYMFSFCGQLKIDLSSVGINYDGPMHGSDLPFLAKNIFVDENNATARDHLIRTQMIGMWTNFAKYGNPTPEDDDRFTTTWKPITNNDNFTLLQIDDQIKMIDFPWKDRMNIWEKLFV